MRLGTAVAQFQLLPSDLHFDATSATVVPATSSATKRGPVAKRRFQKGQFQVKENGAMYSLYWEDVQGTDGSVESKRVRHPIGNLKNMSERAGRREHERIMHEVNQKRGSVAPAIRGRMFNDCVVAWRSAVAPHLSPSTVRQRESYLRAHILPRFKDAAPHSLDYSTLQQFATDLRKTLSRKTTINILSATFVILEYARKCGTLVATVEFADLELGQITSPPESPYFTREQAERIIAEAPEPYHTLFAVAWLTGLRAGEILALGLDDLDFERKTIRVRKSADDQTRLVQQTKTRKSTAILPMPSVLADALSNYLANHWQANEPRLLFPNPDGTKSRLRENVVVWHLHPILKKLGMPTYKVGLHAFRHGLATELAEMHVSLPTLQQQMRHASLQTTIGIYSHVIQKSHRDEMERFSTGTNVPIGTKSVDISL